MKKRRITIICVIVILALTCVSFGASALKAINVDPNTAKIYVNNNLLNADNFNYNGTLYVPLRAISEEMGMVVGWDQASKAANIYNNTSDTSDINGSTNAMYLCYVCATAARESNMTASDLCSYVVSPREYGNEYLKMVYNQAYDIVSMMNDENITYLVNLDYVDQKYINMFNSVKSEAEKLLTTIIRLQSNGIQSINDGKAYIDDAYTMKENFSDMCNTIDLYFETEFYSF